MNINGVRAALAAMLPSPPYSVGDVHYGGRYTDGDLFKMECVDWDGFRVCGRPVEVHFEAQQAYDADKPGILRLDCHFAPYDEFANLSEDDYVVRVGADAAEARINLMRRLGAAANDVCPAGIRLRKCWQVNALWAAEWTLSDDNAACEIKAVVDALADGVTHILREL